jgi:hypothetical protein
VRTTSTIGHLDELFDNVACAGDCALSAGQGVTVAGTATTTGIDFRLQPGSRISGTVGLPGGVLTTGLIRVDIYAADGTFVTFGQTDGNGRYTTRAGLRPGTYYARTVNTLGFGDVLFGGAVCSGACTVTAGTPITVPQSGTVDNVSFVLRIP